MVVLLLVAGVMATAFWGVRIWLNRYSNPLSGMNVMSLSEVTLRNPENQQVDSIEPQLWTSVIDYFKSSVSVIRPPEAACLAEVIFYKKNSQQIRVQVLDSGRDVGFFRVNGVVYRGGDERFFVRMLDDANQRRKQNLNSPSPR